MFYEFLCSVSSFALYSLKSHTFEDSPKKFFLPVMGILHRSVVFVFIADTKHGVEQKDMSFFLAKHFMKYRLLYQTTLYIPENPSKKSVPTTQQHYLSSVCYCKKVAVTFPNKFITI